MADSEGKLAFKGIGTGHSGNVSDLRAHAYNNIFKESVGLGIAEFVSMGVSLGVVAVADDLAPNLIRKATKFVAKTCITPFQDTIEWGIGKVCKLKEAQVDYTRSRSERAEQYAHFMVIFGAAFVPSMVAKMGTRMGLNKLLGVKSATPLTGNWFKDHILPSSHDVHVMIRDEGIHLGAIAVMNTVFAKETDKALNGTKAMLQKTFGWSEEKSRRVAEMFVVWEIPNWLGLASGIHCIAGHHLKNIPAAGTSHVANLVQDIADTASIIRH